MIVMHQLLMSPSICYLYSPHIYRIRFTCGSPFRPCVHHCFLCQLLALLFDLAGKTLSCFWNTRKIKKKKIHFLSAAALGIHLVICSLTAFDTPLLCVGLGCRECECSVGSIVLYGNLGGVSVMALQRGGQRSIASTIQWLMSNFQIMAPHHRSLPRTAFSRIPPQFSNPKRDRDRDRDRDSSTPLED